MAFLQEAGSRPEESAIVRFSLAGWGSRLVRRLDGFRRPQLKFVQFSYEKAGLRVDGEPIPWNAEAVLVEAEIRFPADAPWRKSDFQLRVPGSHPSLAVQVGPTRDEHCFRVLFRLPPINAEADATIFWQGCKLGTIGLPMLSSDRFFGALRLETLGVCVRIGDHAVTCESFVEEQGQGLAACGLLTSATSLLPLLDSTLSVEFKDEDSGLQRMIAVRLTNS
jgi:hypothetical protein